MNPTISIREAGTADLGDLARLNALFNGSKDTAQQLAKRWAHPHCAEIPIVAELDNRIVGFAALRVTPYLFYPGAHAELTELFVENGYRRQGVAKALISRAEALARSKNASELVLHVGQANRDGRHFYTAQGYEDWEIVMGKSLAAE